MVLMALMSAAGAQQPDVVFVPTPQEVVDKMLEIANVGKGDVLYDLGSGDGRIPVTAAKRFGIRAVGIDIDPQRIAEANENARKNGVTNLVQFKREDLFKTKFADATVITLYLLPEVNLELRPKLLALKAGTRIVSHDWDMGDWPPERSLQLDVPDKQIGREKSSKVHLWIIPARLAGAWCGGTKKKPVTLQVDQKYSQMRGAVMRGGVSHKFDARIRGTQVQSVDGDLVWNLEGDRLKAVVARNAFGALRSVTFSRRTGDSCS